MMTERFRIEYGMDQHSFCCGANEVGAMDWDHGHPRRGETNEFPSEDGWYPTKAGAIKHHIKEVIEESDGRPIVYWFVRRCDYNKVIKPETKFDMDELRQVFKRKKGVVKLGTVSNPGTRNQLDGYMLTSHPSKRV